MALGGIASLESCLCPVGLVTRAARSVEAGQVFPSSKGAGHTLNQGLHVLEQDHGDPVLLSLFPFSRRAEKVVCVTPFSPTSAAFGSIRHLLPFGDDGDN